jgi:succinoglycan biosynthesis transport protein ExoP
MMSQSPMGPRSPQGAPPAGGPARPSGPVATPAAVNAAVLDPVRLLRMYWHWLAVAVLVGALLGLASYMVLSRTMPRYRAKVTFMVSPPSSADNFLVQGETGNRDEIERFIATEAGRMLSDNVLQLVVEDPYFQQLKWAQPYMRGSAIDVPVAMEELRKILSAGAIPLTNFFELRCVAPTPDDAAEIARLVADTYINSRAQLQNTRIRAERSRVQTQIQSLSSQLENSIKTINDMLGNNNITSLRETDTEYAIEIRQLQSQLNALRQQKTIIAQNLQSLQAEHEASGGQVYPQAVIAESERDPIAMQLKAEVVSLEADLNSMLERLGRNHSNVVLIESRIRSRQDRYNQIVAQRQKELYATLIDSRKNEIAALDKAEADIVTRLEAAVSKQKDITQIIKRVEDATRDRDMLMARLDNMRIQDDDLQLIADRGIRVTIDTRARRPEGRAFPRLIIFLPLGVLLASGLACGLVVFKELREQRIRTPQDVGLIPRTKLLGALPDLSLDPAGASDFARACLQHPDGTIAESMRQIRATILKRLELNDQKSLLLASAAPSSGGSSVASNLGVSLARVDKRVLLIDANLRKPSLHQIFGQPAGPGLAELLRNEAGGLTDLAKATSEQNLWLLPAGLQRSGVFDRLNTADMRALVEQAEREYDIVLIDAPPAVVSTDALAIAQHVGSSVLVVRAFAETRGMLARLRNQFADVHAEFLGVILNAVPPSAGGYMKRNMQQTFEYSKGVVDSSRGKGKGGGKAA